MDHQSNKDYAINGPLGGLEDYPKAARSGGQLDDGDPCCVYLAGRRRADRPVRDSCA
jgi:hypothetical protein